MLRTPVHESRRRLEMIYPSLKRGTKRGIWVIFRWQFCYHQISNRCLVCRMCKIVEVKKALNAVASLCSFLLMRIGGFTSNNMLPPKANRAGRAVIGVLLIYIPAAYCPDMWSVAVSVQVARDLAVRELTAIQLQRYMTKWKTVYEFSQQ